MQKKVMVPLAKGFEEIEAVTIIDILRRSYLDVTVVSVSADTYYVTGSHNITIKADELITGLNTDNFSAIVLPGGMPGALNLRNSAEVRNTVKDFFEKEKIVAAICASPSIVLSDIGILEGKKATCYPGMESEFKGNVIQNTDKPIETDGNIITGNGPANAAPFALKIVELIQGKAIADKLAKQLLYK